MNKKIVFSLALLSAFSYASADTRTPLQIGIAQGDSVQQHQGHLDKCFDLRTDNRTVDGLNDCAKLRKFNDDIYVHCKANNEVGLTENSDYFHLINILTQKGDVYKNPEKVRYVALRQCGITYYESRMYSAYKTAFIYNKNDDAVKYIDGYNKTIEGLAEKEKRPVCKKVFEAELDYIKNHLVKTNSDSKISLDDIDFDPYYKAVGYYAPTIQGLNANEFGIGSVKLQSNFSSVNKKMLQEFYKEFQVNTTGRVIVSSSPAVTNGQYLVYLLDQNDFASSNGWIYKNFSNIVGDKTNANDIEGMRGCSSLDPYINPPLNPSTIDSSHRNKLIFINEKYNNEVVLGVCDVYNRYLSINDELKNNYSNEKKFIKDRALEAIILKNSKIKPYSENDKFLADYNTDSSYGNRVNDYAGGVSKCYNYNLEDYNSSYSRAYYLDWKNELDYRKDDAKEISRKNYVFSIHKPNGGHKGIFLNEGSSYNFSVNIRPSLKFITNRDLRETNVSDIKIKFIPDADYYQITDEANKTDKKDNVPLKVTNLNDVYIALNNSKTKFNASDRLADNISVKYYLTKFEITKQQIANENGAIDGTKEVISDNNSKYELVLKDNINGEFGLRFTEDTFLKLAKFSKEELKKELDKGNVYSLKFTPLEIMEHITETNKVEDCPKSGVCKIVDEKREYYRPMFQASGVDIIKGAPKGSVEIILGNTKMPNTTFGTAYNIVDSDMVIENNKISSNTKIANKIYTRTNKQDIYIGFTKDNNKPLYNQYIKFYNGSKELEADVYNSNKRVTKVITECQGYYPIDNKMVLHLKKMDVGQDYNFSYKIAEYDTKFNSCFELGEIKSNNFSIRPEGLEYTVAGKDSFEKKVGRNDTNYKDNDVVINASIKDDRFGVGIAELRVDDSKGNNFVFSLEDKNKNQLNDLAKDIFADFNKDGDFAIKTVFPMVTDAKIALAESKFTIDDYKNGLCEDNNKAVNKKTANEINSKGKIYCQTPGNELSVNFSANETLGLEKDNNENAISPYLTNQNFVNYVPFSDKDGERLAIPLQITSKNASEYFYKKFSDNEAKLLLDLKYSKVPNLNKMIVKVDPANTTLDITATSKIGEFSINNLNKTFDEKLVELKGIKLSDYDEINFDAKDFGKINFKIGYLKNTGTKPNLDPVFKIIGANAKVEFKNSKPLEYPNILSNSYEFAYTGMFFKDLNKNTGKSREIKPDDAWVFKYDNNKFVKVPNANINDFKKLFNGAKGDFIFTSDYSRNAFKGNTYNIPSNVSNNQYFKDTLRFRIDPSNNNSYLDSNASFTIEFIK